MPDEEATFWRGEHLSLVRDDRVGLRAAIAVNSTVLGPALGGVRFARYPNRGAGILEAQRLGAAMTLKNALAGIPFGGGKSVVFRDGPVEDREALMSRFGEFVARLGGTYVPGIDMGTSVADLGAMARAGASMVSVEDPSPSTALGVFRAIQAAVVYRFGREDLDGLQVLIQGVGHVGAALAGYAAGVGASVLVSDVDAERAKAVAASVGGRVVEPSEVVTTASDIFVPCAIARVVDEITVQQLDTKIIAGAANDTLASDDLARDLAQRGIVYVPDFVANAGGVLKMCGEMSHWTDQQLNTAIDGIGERVRYLLRTPVKDNVPLYGALEIAERIINGGSVPEAFAPHHGIAA